MRRPFSLLLVVALAVVPPIANPAPALTDDRPTPAAQGRHPVPASLEEVATARERIRTLLADLYAKQGAGGAQALVRTLLAKAGESKPGSVFHYVLLDEAVQAVPRSEDVRLGLEVLDAILTTYDVASVPCRLLVLPELEPARGDGIAAALLGERLLELGRDSARMGDVPAAQRVLKQARSLARERRLLRLEDRIREASDEVPAWRTLHQRATVAFRRLESNPDHGRSHVDLARFEYLVRRDWDAMLAHLAQAPDEELRAFARRDLEGDASEVELARGWRALAEKEREPLREAFYQRADLAYEAAIATESDGLEKLALEVEREQIQPLFGPRHCFVGDLDERDVHVGFARLIKNGRLPEKAPDEMQMVEGTFLLHSLYLHPGNEEDFAYARYDLGKRWSTVEGSVSIADSNRGRPTVPLRFEVLGDDEPLWRSKEVTGQDDEQDFRIDVTGVRILELRVTAEGHNRNCDAMWIEPRLRR